MTTSSAAARRDLLRSSEQQPLGLHVKAATEHERRDTLQRPASPLHRAPVVLLRQIRRDRRAVRRIPLCRSSGYAPAAAAEIFDLIRVRFVDETAFALTGNRFRAT